MDLGERVVVGSYRLGSAVARALPGMALGPAERALGMLLSRGSPSRRRMLERHMRRIYGADVSRRDLRRAVQRSFDSYARYWVESFRLPDLSADDLDAGFSHEGTENLDRALARGHGAIVALPHLGGWEWAGAWLATRGYPITVVVEPLEPRELFEWFADFRRSLGMTIVPLGAGAGAAVLGALRRNETLALLSDRDIGGSGVEVEFFGEKTTLPAGPATLALRTGAPILPAAVYYRDGMHHGVVRQPLPVSRTGTLREDVSRVTQDLARQLEELIRVAPDQWHLLQPNWPSDRDELS